MQPNGHLYVCVCLCGRLEPCTHTNCTVCIKCEHVCKHMYKLIFYTRYCNRFVLYMQLVRFISTDCSGFLLRDKKPDGIFFFSSETAGSISKNVCVLVSKQLNPLKCLFEDADFLAIALK